MTKLKDTYFCKNGKRESMDTDLLFGDVSKNMMILKTHALIIM